MQLIRFVKVLSNVSDVNNRNQFLGTRKLKQGYRYHKNRKVFSKFCHRHWICFIKLIVKYNLVLNTLLQLGISMTVFYGDLVYKLNKLLESLLYIVIVVSNSKYNKKRYKKVGYNMGIMRQSACLVVNPITVYSYGIFFNCMAVSQASGSMMAVAVSWCLMCVFGWAHHGST